MAKKTHVETTLNGDPLEFLVEPRQSLLESLRDVVHMTGTKEGCNDGNCGACSVLLDGVLVNSCCVLGVEAQGRTVETVEGSARPTTCTRCSRRFWKKPACSAASARRAF